MISHLRQIFPHSFSNCRHIRSTCIRLDEKVSYEEGKVKVVETTPESFRNHHITSTERWVDKYHFDRLDFTIKGVKRGTQRYLRNRERIDQSYNPSRVQLLGDDLAAATFFVYRGAVLKFVGCSKLFNFNCRHLIPNVRDESFLVEAVDANGVEKLYYEALDNLKRLNHLKWLSFRGCEMFDNWYLDRLSHIVPKVEYLDISFCKNITPDALHCLYRMKSLKCLNVEGISNSIEFQLGCLTVESENPDLTVLGVIPKPVVKSAFDIDLKMH